MRDDDSAGQQVQPVLDAARKLPVFNVEIFRIADNGMADMRGMGAQLMGAPGHWPHHQPGELLAGLFGQRIMSDRMVGAWLAVAGDNHAIGLVALAARQKCRNAAARRLRHALHQRPVELARLARPESLAKGCGG